MKRQNNSNFSQPPRLTIILGSFLEVLTHEIIYTRSLYPHDAFSPTRHYGVACHDVMHVDVDIPMLWIISLKPFKYLIAVPISRH